MGSKTQFLNMLIVDHLWFFITQIKSEKSTLRELGFEVRTFKLRIQSSSDTCLQKALYFYSSALLTVLFPILLIFVLQGLIHQKIESDIWVLQWAGFESGSWVSIVDSFHSEFWFLKFILFARNTYLWFWIFVYLLMKLHFCSLYWFCPMFFFFFYLNFLHFLQLIHQLIKLLFGLRLR